MKPADVLLQRARHWDETALAQARQAEQELARGIDRGPLHGVPISLKDLFDTAGVRKKRKIAESISWS